MPVFAAQVIAGMEKCFRQDQAARLGLPELRAFVSQKQMQLDFRMLSPDEVKRVEQEVLTPDLFESVSFAITSVFAQLEGRDQDLAQHFYYLDS